MKYLRGLNTLTYKIDNKHFLIFLYFGGLIPHETVGYTRTNVR